MKINFLLEQRNQRIFMNFLHFINNKYYSNNQNNEYNFKGFHYNNILEK